MDVEEFLQQRAQPERMGAAEAFCAHAAIAPGNGRPRRTPCCIVARDTIHSIAWSRNVCSSSLPLRP